MLEPTTPAGIGGIVPTPGDALSLAFLALLGWSESTWQLAPPALLPGLKHYAAFRPARQAQKGGALDELFTDTGPSVSVARIAVEFVGPTRHIRTSRSKGRSTARVVRVKEC